MSFGYMRLRGALSIAAAAAFIFGAPVAAMAQDAAANSTGTIPVEQLPDTPEQKKAEKKAEQLQAVEVTGSRVKRAATETAQPVVKLTRKDLERTGAATIGDILQTLPAAGSSLNTTINNGGTGATEVDLRNLGSNRVLVLVDGHRWVNGLRSLSTNSVDLNTIPLAIIDRVDILQDGASAIYGSDAITGIVNIITRKKFNGVNISAQAGSYTQGDGRQQLHTISAGKSLDGLFGGQSTSFFSSFSFQDQSPVFAGDRDISKIPLAGTGLTRGSSFTPTTRSLFVASNSTVGNFGTTRCPNLAGAVADGAVNSDTSVDLPQQAGGGHVTTVPNPMIPIPSQLDSAAGINLCNFTLNGGAAGNAASDYHQFVATNDAYNYALTNYLSTPLRTYNGFVSAEHEFTENFRFSIQGLYSKRQSTQQLAPQPISIGDIGPVQGGLMPGSTQSYNQATFVPASNPFNPTRSNPGMAPGSGPQDFGRLVTSSTVDPAAAASNNDNVALGLFYSGAALRRMVEGDPRIQKQTVPTRFLRGGFEGSFDLFNLPTMSWEAGYSYGISYQAQTLLNQYRTDRIRLAVTGNYVATANNTAAQQDIPADILATLNNQPCGTVGANTCVPLNFFGGPGTVTRQMLDYITYTDFSTTRTTQTDFYGNLSFTVPFAMLADDIGVALGIERRTSKYTNIPSPEAINGTTAGLTSDPTDGSVAAKEAYLELDLPLVKDLPFLSDASLDLAGRISDYGAFGKTNNGKLGLKIHPVKDLLLRGAFSTSFRAPNTGELFLGNAGSYPGLTDPCAAPEAGSVAERNCNADGIPTYSQTVSQFYAPFTGNRNLKPETSHSLTTGFVFSPAAITGFDMSVDYFRIKLDNFITAPGAQFELDQCYKTTGRAYCGTITRNGQNQLQSVLNAFSNFPSTDTAGFDYSLNYTLPTKNFPALANLGKFKLVTNATFLSTYAQTLLGNDGKTLTRTGYAGTLTLPRWKINPQLQWSRGPLSGSVTQRIIWGSYENCDDGLTPSLTSLGLCSDPNYRDNDGNLSPRNRVRYASKTDLQLGYNYKPYKTNLTLGVGNILNRDPPISYSSANSFESGYWVPGVLPYLKLQKDF